MDTIISTSETTANLRCRDCKSKGRRTGTIVTESWAYEGRPASHSHLEIGGRKFPVRDRYDIDRALWTPCPDCGSPKVTVNRVKGSYNESKECGARCRNAIGADCECTCSGEHHGASNKAW